jgi:hypothetical protein
MSKLTKALTAAAGNAGESSYVEDVFSTYLYTGNNTGTNTQNIVNGIDLAGKGGAVWIKTRNVAWNHGIWDTETDGGNLYTNTTDAQQSNDDLASFNSDGFGVSSAVGTGWYNFNDQPQVSWTFRKAEKFFDVVTYTGDGNATHEIAHNLGSVPGCIIIKNTSGAWNWLVYHKDSTNDLNLNTTSEGFFSLVDSVTSTSFNFSSFSSLVNASGSTYVAYLFASDAGGFGDDGSESIIKCGSYGPGTETLDGPEVNLGWEPQWVLTKCYDNTGDWVLHDNMRGVATNGNDKWLRPNTSGAELTSENIIFTSTGFKITSASAYVNQSGYNYIYIAIRRPMKTPESGTEVFSPNAVNVPAGTQITTGFPVDVAFATYRLGQGTRIETRLAGVSTITGSNTSKYLNAFSTAAENAAAGYLDGWNNIGHHQSVGYANAPDVYHSFKRATGFFDVVAYTGDGTPSNTVRRDLKHNLGVAPELAILKRRNSTSEWQVAADGKELYLNLNLASQGTYTPSSYFNATDFDVEGWVNEANNNVSGSTYIAYLFATLAGVSKVGSYTGTGSNVNVDCGFSAGARFILIKRTDSTGDWYVWDSVRGIVAGNDPYLLLNSTAAEVTSTDYIDPLSSGFTVTSSAPAALNASGGTYIYLSIA